MRVEKGRQQSHYWNYMAVYTLHHECTMNVNLAAKRARNYDKVFNAKMGFKRSCFPNFS
jgi:hypothetical protein